MLYINDSTLAGLHKDEVNQSIQDIQNKISASQSKEILSIS